MAIALVTAPAEMPVTLAEAKLHLRLSTSEDDSYVNSLIAAATSQAESETNRAFITQTWDYFIDKFPSVIYLPKPQLQSVTSISYIDSSGSSQILSSALYQVDTKSERARIKPNDGETWPSIRYDLNSVSIRFVCGYGDAADVPEAVKQAILMIIGSMYEFRESISVVNLTEIPLSAKNLLSPYNSRVF